MKPKKEKVVLGKTKNGATISICINCENYNISHFNYEKGRKYYSIEFERAVPLDHGNLMDLKERTDLEIFFATYNEDYKMTNWQLAIKVWNDNNKIQIPNNLHKPYYRNMIEEIDNYTISTWNNRQGLSDEMQIYCDEDVEAEPHFHVKLQNGTDIAIYFKNAQYLKPLSRKLTNEELNVLIKYLQAKCSMQLGKFKADMTNWQYLIFAWNNQNVNSQGSIYPYKEELDENIEMPDYRNLNEMEQ